MKLLYAFALAVLAACGSYRLPDQPSPTADVRSVADVQMYQHDVAWQQTPWARITDAFDVSWPVFVVVAVDGSACLVTAQQWAVAQPRQRFACSTRWRMSRRVR